ncbi:MAG: hypothetical protein H7Z37_11490 [Pyrinomonadaceae bacterium]|nr:hypothetical protein [Pyrinomonadaceae bacterium]
MKRKMFTKSNFMAAIIGLLLVTGFANAQDGRIGRVKKSEVAETVTMQTQELESAFEKITPAESAQRTGRNSSGEITRASNMAELEAKEVQEDAKSQDERAARCPLNLTQILTGGINDNAVTPFDATNKSTALTTFYASFWSPSLWKDYDDKAINRVFGDSFNLAAVKPCNGAVSRICRAKLVIKICNDGVDIWQNDKIYVSDSTGGVHHNASLYYGNVWLPSESRQCKLLSIPMNTPAQLATLNAAQSLDVVVQDDSYVDFMRLTLNY